MAEFETVVVETDLLILGGGMAACGAAVEAAYWAKQNGLKVTLVDKAAMDRSGAVAMGLSAINQYVGLKDGANTIKDYVDYVRNDLMGVTREDLVANIARHVDSTVHLFEKWGLPIWKDENGAYRARRPLAVDDQRRVLQGDRGRGRQERAARERRGRDLRARVHRGPADGRRPLRRRGGLLGAREQVLRLQGQGHAGRHGRRGARVQAPEFRRRHGPRLVSAMELGLLGLLHAEGRRGDDLPGSALHPGPLQGRVRSGGRMVPAVQVARDQRRGRQLHDRAQAASSRSGARTAG